jgi:alkaline phosphatase
MKSRVAASGVLALCHALAAAPAPARAETPKNVILFIGDGMGAEQVKASGLFNNGATGLFNFEQFTHQAWMTHNNAGGTVTDSAASATAIATGVKVNDGVISLSGGNPLYTLLERYYDANKSTGLVTTSYMTDATPAAFAAHRATRGESQGIADDYFDNLHKPNVLFGAAATGFNTTTTLAEGYTTVTNKTQLQAINTAATTHAAGVFPADAATSGFGYFYDNAAYYASNPRLEEMTQTALDILDNDNDGFFLMVENELTDSSGHQPVGSANKIERNAAEVRQLSLAVQRAINFAATHPDTLILVTGDHETGAFTANNAPGTLSGVVSGSGSHQATWLPVWATGPNAGHVTGIIDNTDISGIVLSTAPEPVLATRKTFQQGVNGYTGAHDTHVRGNATDAALAFGATPTLVVDGSDGGAPSQAVLRFDNLFGALAIPDGAEIRSARLTLHTGNAANDQTNDTLAIHRLLVAFTEATTWNSAGNQLNNGFSLNGAGTGDDDYLATAESTFVSPDMNALVMFDVTATLQAWLANPSNNFGWLIASSGTDGWRWDSSEGAIAALRPMLEVTFVPEPSSLALLALPAAALLRRRRR